MPTHACVGGGGGAGVLVLVLAISRHFPIAGDGCPGRHISITRHTAHNTTHYTLYTLHYTPPFQHGKLGNVDTDMYFIVSAINEKMQVWNFFHILGSWFFVFPL